MLAILFSMRKIGDTAALTFIVFVIVLATMSVLSFWEVFEVEVFLKSLATVAVLTVATVIVLIYAHLTESSQNNTGESLKSEREPESEGGEQFNR